MIFQKTIEIKSLASVETDDAGITSSVSIQVFLWSLCCRKSYAGWDKYYLSSAWGSDFASIRKGSVILFCEMDLTITTYPVKSPKVGNGPNNKVKLSRTWHARGETLIISLISCWYTLSVFPLVWSFHRYLISLLRSWRFRQLGNRQNSIWVHM